MFLFKNLNGYYYLYYNCNNSGLRKKISTKTKIKSEALKFLSTFQQSDKPESQRIGNILLSQFKKEMLEYYKINVKPNTLKLYESAFRNLLNYLNDKHIKLITVKDIEKYKAERINKINPTSLNIELRHLKAGFNIAVKLNYLKVNPFNQIKKLSIPQSEILCFTSEQTKLILNNCNNNTLKNFVLISLYTGSRINETINLQWKDVNFQEMFISIRNKSDFRTKTDKSRNIPISNSLEYLLKELYESELTAGNIADINILEKYIFRKPAGNFKISSEFISKQFKKVLRRLNFPEKFHFHCLRHTFITNLIKSDVNINFVKELAGHSDIKTTMNYIHIQNEDLLNAVNKIKINY